MSQAGAARSEALWPAETVLKANARRFAATLPQTISREPDAKQRELRDVWTRCAEFGLFAMVAPPSEPESASVATNLLEVLEGLGEGCSNDGLFLALGAHMLAVMMPLVHFGTPEQKARYLPRLVDGSWIGAHAATEGHGGSDVMGLRTRYETTADGRFALDGVKEFVTNSPMADLFLVFATRDPELGFMGVSAFLVERSDPGVIPGPNVSKMGLEGSTLASVVFEGGRCVVPADRMLGKVGRGRDIFATSMLWERTLILAPQVGAMKRQLVRSIEYARSRKISGRAIGRHQMISGRIADMYVRYISLRALLAESARLLDQGILSPAVASVAKLLLSESALEQHMDALRIHGGAGYLTEVGIESEVRDSIGGLLYSGTSEMQRVIIAQELGL